MTTRTLCPRRLAPLPTSAARNAAELFRDVGRLIAAEPARFYYDYCVAAERSRRRTFRDGDALFGGWIELPLPACGTLACLGGWAHLLLLPVRPRGASRQVDHVLRFFRRRDRDLAEAMRQLFCYSCPAAAPGTRAYTRAGLRVLRWFRQDWAAALRAIPLGPAERAEFRRLVLEEEMS